MTIPQRNRLIVAAHRRRRDSDIITTRQRLQRNRRRYLRSIDRIHAAQECIAAHRKLRIIVAAEADAFNTLHQRHVLFRRRRRRIVTPAACRPVVVIFEAYAGIAVSVILRVGAAIHITHAENQHRTAVH